MLCSRVIGRRWMGWLLGLGMLAGGSMAGRLQAEELPAPSTEDAAAVALEDTSGKPITVGDLSADSAWVVVAFLGTECPLARLYAPRLNQLAAEYAQQGVRFLAVDANRQDTAAELAAFARQHQLSFPVLRDPQARLADALGATRTPEVFVLDEKHAVRYFGRIDDQYTPGIQKPAPTRRDLAVALDELLAGKAASQPHLAAAGCLIGREREAAADAEVTYAGQVAGIFRQHCVSCHRPGQIGPFSLVSYDDALGWGETIREVVEAGRMPPWFASPEHGKFANDTRLSEADRRAIDQWVTAGCPSGDLASLPALPDEVAAEPQYDLVLPMSDGAFAVPAEGVVDYQYYTVDPGWKEDRWVSNIDVLPGNRGVVHHVLVFVRRPKAFYSSIYPGELIGGYVPGLGGIHYPEKMAMRLPAGSKIVYQMHYTPNGTATEDLTRIGMRFARAEEVTHEVRAEKAINILFQIPPQVSDYQAQSTYTFTRDAQLLSLIPHMHLRGRAFRYEAEYPDGRREVLLDVPRYDFNWQLEYVLAEPKAIPAGTRLWCTARFDNSADNPSNPDSSQWVTFGEQTWQEMLIGFFVIAEDRQRTPADEVESLLASARATADLFRDLGQQRPWTDQVLRVTQQADHWLRAAQRRGLFERTPVVHELGHILWAGVAEAQKQQVLRNERPAVDLRRGVEFVRRLRQAVEAVGEEGSPTEHTAAELTADGAAGP